jgi:hypothetical protein
MLWWPSWLPRTDSRKPEPRYRANFLTSLRMMRRLSKESGKWLRAVGFDMFFYLSLLNIKDPLVADPVLQPRPVRKDENVGRCIPCSIPDSIRGQANYMFRNGYNIWCRSRTLCSCLRRKSVYWYVTCQCYGRWWCQLMFAPLCFLLLVLFPSSIACYESNQRAFCANNHLHNRWGRGYHSPFWSGIYGW